MERAIQRFYEAYARFCQMSVEDAKDAVLLDFAFSVIESMTPKELSRLLSP